MCCTVCHVRCAADHNRKSQPFLLKSQVHLGKRYFSRVVISMSLSSISSKEVISALKFCFSEFGIPEEVLIDNGKQFTGKEYQDFAVKYGFKLTTSSSYHPKGHGVIERQMQTIKSLNKCDGDGTNHYLALLQLKATQIDSRLPS